MNYTTYSLLVCDDVGGKKKPLKQAKKQQQDFDEVSHPTVTIDLKPS